MRINLRYLTSNSTHDDHTDDPAWLQLLMHDFINAYDINEDSDDIWGWLYKREASKLIIEWMVSEGYKCRQFELPLHNKDGRDPRYMAWGLEIEDNCEKFVELKLRAYGDNK